MPERSRRIAVIGFGLVGRQRAAAVEELHDAGAAVELVAVTDVVEPRGGHPAFVKSIEDALDRHPELVVVALPHDVAVDAAAVALEAGADVLLEKPLGRNLSEGVGLVEVAERCGRRLSVGFNYRFMPGVQALLRDIEEGWFGEIVSVEMTLGHGGSPDDASTWKLDPERAGGGCLIDPGIHLLDLAGLMAATPVGVRAATSWRGHWETGIEEECHLLLEAPSVPVFNITVSVVRWRSTFVLRVNGVDGYGVVTGRGRSYGPQRYVRGRRWGWRHASSQAESEELVCEVSADQSFREELHALLRGSFGGRAGVAGPSEALEAMRLLEACREAAGARCQPLSERC